MERTRRRTAVLVVVAALAPATLAPPAAGAARAGPLIGMGEQKPGMFDDESWKRLGLGHVRYTTPWDTLKDPYQLQLLDTWMAAAKRTHARVLLGFAHSLRSEELAHTLPTQWQFEREFKRLRKRYPWVRDWLAWNEANNPGALTASRPRRAAQYFDAIARSCRGCRVVAADLIDTSNMASWTARFVRHARAKPRIWGLHNYSDVNGLTVRNTRKLLALTRGAIWFTETGGVVLRRTYKNGKVWHTYRYSLRHAARATAHALRLGCLSRRISRVYLYHWQAPFKVTSWDSGLLDARGRPRPAYTALRDSLARGERVGRSGGRRALCRAVSSRPAHGHRRARLRADQVRPSLHKNQLAAAAA